MNKLNQAITEKNIVGLRNLLKAYITGDPADSDATIKNSLQKIYANGIDVWQPYDGKELNMSSNTWNEDYFVDLQVDLRMNFSKERYLHMLEVGKKVYGVSVVASPTLPTQTVRTSTSNQQYMKVDNKKKSKALVWGIAALGAFILGIVLIKMIKTNS
ncbi:hypothetical protein KQ3_04943 [Bacillus cereus B5-2]|uniref:Uncharacterized protein n=1 Tax=Bacillus wiedmannii TaxID=1890302 RepID=A0A2C3ULS5_9BACI|nr:MULTISPECIES: hypothetical protein [Bacillus cereus group]EOQ16029.1 hypothetical protein KQ3_04943 [Bacillus cereus B5-2]PFW81811.1 hypothetical protein COL27_18795 [Bacillus sp. AFS075960]MCC2327125.1 hypothetical protein [Bacillus wiedmannii]PEW46903.1 hypothetical protein CN431_10940 [Bacillus cereus]PFR16747.1 hypothetical protein COK23_24840 [Bacillus cereus]